MQHTAATTVPVKLSLSGSKRRSRLNVPLKFSQLAQQVRTTFPDVKDFHLQYVDEEGDKILVTSDADLEEARNVYMDLGRVLSFVVQPLRTKPASPASKSTFAAKPHGCRRGCRRGRHPLVKSMEFPGLRGHFAEGLKGLRALFANGSVPVLHFGITCDGSNQHPLLGKRYHKIGHNYDLNETEFVKLTPDEQKKYEVIDYPSAVPVPVTTRITARPIHHGVTCDGSNQQPLVGVRYHKIGHNYDLNEPEFAKLTPNEQKKYEIISHPGATAVPVANAPDCVFVRDVTIPDGQVVPPGKEFKKTWLVKTGVTGWPAGCSLTHICGDKMGAASRIALAPQKPHALVDVSIVLTSPSRPGKVTSKWRAAGPDGKVFGHELWSTIVIKHLATREGASAAAASAAATPHASASASVVETPHASVSASVVETPHASVSASVVETPHASASASAATTAPASASAAASVRQLLEMGFTFPVHTLQSVLNSVNGDLQAAVSKLISHDTY